MNKLVSVTVNSAIDVIVDEDVSGLERRAESAGGKGVNVARAASAMGVRVEAIVVVGINERQLFAGIGGHNVTVHPIEVDGPTRRNVTKRGDPDSSRAIGVGYEVRPEDLEAVQRELEGVVSPGDIVVLAGSLPVGAPPDLYARLIRRVRGAGALTILDTRGKALRVGVEASPDYIKPNRVEFEELTGHPTPSIAAIVESAAAYVDLLDGILVSVGEDGIVVIDKSVNAWHMFLPVPVSDNRTSLGCGDAVVAGLAAGLLGDRAFVEACKLGVAAGTANLDTTIPGMISRSATEEYLGMVQVRSVG